MSVPSFYEPANAARPEYAPDQQAVFAAAAEHRRARRLRPAAGDVFKVHLLLVDVQKDFCFPSGSLYVAGRSGTGAIDDSRRISEFIYHNLGVITHITSTLDSHVAYQIFFPSFWVDADGAPLAAHREITTEQIDAGEVHPDPAVAGWLCDSDTDWLRRQVRHYCQELESAGRYRLYLWPPHCLLGSDGHAMVGLVHEARLFHAFARGDQSWIETKGTHVLTENYSVLRPEVLVRHDGSVLAERNLALYDRLLAADALLVAGQAASHCVKSTIDDLLDEIRSRDPALAAKVYILADCMSAVTVPDGAGGFAFDFTPQADLALGRFVDAGMHLVRAADPMTEWPGMPGRHLIAAT